MPQNPVDLDLAVNTLREEEAPSTLMPRVLGSIVGPQRSKWTKPTLAVGISVLVLAVAFLPRNGSGVAWAQSVDKTLNAPFMYRESKFENGTIGFQQWISGKRQATLLFKPDGTVMGEMRSNGKRVANYFDMSGGQTVKNPSPNAVPYASVFDEATRPGPEMMFNYESMESLLAGNHAKVLSHETELNALGFEVYRVKINRPVKSELLIEVEPKSRRIRGVTRGKSKLRESVEYPDSIPDQVFEPRIQVAKNVTHYDIGAQNLAAVKTIKAGLGKNGPVTLRLVVMDSLGSVWAFWTGATPDPKLSRPIEFPGVPSSAQFGLKEFTTRNTKTPPPFLLGFYLGGMARTPKVKVGKFLDVNIPCLGRVAKFRHVPIMRVGMLYNLERTLGFKRY